MKSPRSRVWRWGQAIGTRDRNGDAQAVVIYIYTKTCHRRSPFSPIDPVLKSRNQLDSTGQRRLEEDTKPHMHVDEMGWRGGNGRSQRVATWAGLAWVPLRGINVGQIAGKAPGWFVPVETLRRILVPPLVCTRLPQTSVRKCKSQGSGTVEELRIHAHGQGVFVEREPHPLTSPRTHGVKPFPWVIAPPTSKLTGGEVMLTAACLCRRTRSLVVSPPFCLDRLHVVESAILPRL